MSAKTIFAGGNSTFLPALAGIAGAPPAITVSTLTASGAISAEDGLTVSDGLVVASGGAIITAGGLTLPSGNISLLSGTISAVGAISSNGAISAGTTITAGTGLTVSAGGLQVVAGGAEITTGGLTVVDGGIDVNSGGITSGTTITATGDITTTTGDITTTDGTISTATGSMSCANLTAQKLSGGIGALAGTIDVNLDAGATVSEVVTFTNFAGSDVSAYIASYNNYAVALSLLVTASYNAPNGSGTDVNLTVYNFSTDNITTTVSYSIICMN